MILIRNTNLPHSILSFSLQYTIVAPGLPRPCHLGLGFQLLANCPATVTEIKLAAGQHSFRECSYCSILDGGRARHLCDLSQPTTYTLFPHKKDFTILA